MKYILKIINLNRYISYLPTKHSEKSYFEVTKEFDEAEGFELEDLEYLDLKFIEEAYQEKYLMKQHLEIEVMLVIKRNTLEN